MIIFSYLQKELSVAKQQLHGGDKKGSSGKSPTTTPKKRKKGNFELQGYDINME